MQPNKTKLALQIGAVVLGALCASNSYADPFTITVNTLNDVSIDTVQALDFGENITTGASGSCGMNANVPTAAEVLADATTLDGTGFGVITGGNCIGTGVTVATPGIYSVEGVGGLDVNLTLGSLTQTGDFTFTPTGCGVVHNGIGGADANDICTTYTAGTPLTMTLADATDATGANSVENFGHFTVGGTLAVGATPLDSDTNYSVTFNVDVVY